MEGCCPQKIVLGGEISTDVGECESGIIEAFNTQLFNFFESYDTIFEF